MAKDRLDEMMDVAMRGRPHSSRLAAERAELEVSGRNWSARHVADLIDLSELTVKRMARRGKLPAVKVGRAWEFPPSKIRAWYAGEPVELPRRQPSRPKKRAKSKK
ncbi:MAG TPA: helix-turn-helix domain-containing protein [Myxococcales bacterium]|jgi:excisionase family DNA binding protein|nr:helix-turn-helix domain-containing protein [Myxococcales bacterium]